MQDYIYIYNSSGVLTETITQTTDSSLRDRLSGELTLSFTTKYKRLPNISEDSRVEFRGQYYRITRLQFDSAGNEYLLSVSCEQESISLVDEKIEEFNFAGTPSDALARLLSDTGMTATSEFTETIAVSVQGGNRRSVLLEIAALCGGEIEYNGHEIRIVKHRGNTVPIDIMSVCKCYDVRRTVDTQEDTESYELSGLEREGYSVGDEVNIFCAPLGINAQKRIVGITYNPFNCTDVVIEVGDYVQDVTNDNAETNKMYLVKSDAKIEFEKYINSAEGKAGISTALSGTYVTADALGDYVQVADLGAEVDAYLNGAEGTAAIVSAVSGKFMEKPIEPVYSTPSGVTYGFEKTSDGYYTSTNAGVANSFSYGKFTFNSSKAQTITLRCINYAERTYDFGIVSTLNSNLTKSYSADTSNVLYDFRNYATTTPIDISLDIPAGESFITFKYRKDNGTDSYGDYFKIMVVGGDFATTAEVSSIIEQKIDAFEASLTLSVSNGTKSSVISLKSGSTTISSQTIQFTGEVVFKSDLSTAGATTINGANVTTDNLYLKKVYYDADTSYLILSSHKVDSDTLAVQVGMIESIRATQHLELYGDQIWFIPAGSSRGGMFDLMVDIPNTEILPIESGMWWLGNEDHRFSGVCASKFVFADGSYLNVSSGRLRYYNSSGSYTNLT